MSKKAASIQSQGGTARAASLSPEDRSAIARLAAEERWGTASNIAKETHQGDLTITDREIPCSVLDNGLRVFSTRGVSRVIGSRTKGIKNRKPDDAADRKEDAPQLPPFLASPVVRPFISNDLMALLISPVPYKPKSGGRIAYGYEATLLPRICEVVLDANKAGVLRKSQAKLVATAEMLIRGFAHVGIIALVDEATGYQADRARDELNRILSAYISKELLRWTKRFPDEFFRQIYRLEGWEYKEGHHKRPQRVGKLVNELIYQQLPDGVLPQLKKLNPTNETGRRTYRHHQFLTDDAGHPHLNKQIIEVVTLMRISDDKRQFFRLFRKAFPPRGQQLLDYPEDDAITIEATASTTPTLDASKDA